MTKPALLILDDEEEILNALRRVLRIDFELHLFLDPEEALAFYAEHPLPLVISDMRMPTMNGATFLTKVEEINPTSRRFLLTGHADIDATVDAINNGKITHYFSKPWDSNELKSELKSSYQNYVNELKTERLLKINLNKSANLSSQNSILEKKINVNQQQLAKESSTKERYFSRLKQTFSTFIELYAESILLHTQDDTRHNFRVANHAKLIAQQLKAEPLEVFQIYIAALLYETGKMALPQSMLQTPFEALNHQDKKSFRQFYGTSADMLGHINELAPVVEIIKQLTEHYDGSGSPSRLQTNDISLGARIISAITYFDNLIIGRQLVANQSTQAALNQLSKLAGSVFDPIIVAHYKKLLLQMPNIDGEETEYAVNSREVKLGDRLTKDIQNHNHNTLLTKGTELDQQHIDKLKQMENDFNLSFLLFISRAA
ncbi:HD domain-containing phosphohydrolase [Psychrobium sp. 1_MG-2023]|uniref:HD domain-containing phosphohydrolase n=1 Tax=Psychrobium sp. 1_MG-2023 TaxID=3062624 RepID=UPI000C34048C|nr:HD domain-containing phosphohydrolase [Psychrobium sp. 1_MG-2023]MDP2561323.1 response regulator [Psychrobium sp. 1_MG-2023]PKF54137.1 two-component system response regulator [Alteromonadales bacterium alter-6D02]